MTPATALETLRLALDAAWTAASHAAHDGCDTEDIRDALTDLICDCGGLIEDEEEAQEPCSDVARKRGCTCRMEAVYATSIDPPEPIIDKWCELHGRADPDAMRDERMDRRTA